MRLCNFLDFESKGLTRRERLSLLLRAASQAREQARNETERQELEFVYHDCQAALQSLSNASAAEDAWLDRRLRRMTRVLGYYENGIVRLNRRYWWVFFAIGMVLLALAILYGIPSDVSSLDVGY